MKIKPEDIIYPLMFVYVLTALGIFVSIAFSGPPNWLIAANGVSFILFLFALMVTWP